MQPVTIEIMGGTLPGFLAIIVSITAIWSFFSQRRTFLREQGKFLEQMVALKNEVVEQKAKIAALEGKNHSADVTLAKIGSDLEYIKDAIDELKADAKCRQENGK